jgi:hypothetical protein
MELFGINKNENYIVSYNYTDRQKKWDTKKNNIILKIMITKLSKNDVVTCILFLKIIPPNKDVI